MTFLPSLTFTELWVVSMEHLQRVWHAIREVLPLRTPGFVRLLGGLHMFWLLRLVFRIYTDFMTLIPNLTYTTLRLVSMEHLRRVWHASRERLPFGPPFWDLLVLQLLRPDSLTYHVLFDFSPRIPIDTFSILLKWKISEMQILVEYVTVSDGTNIEECDMCNKESFIIPSQQLWRG